MCSFSRVPITNLQKPLNVAFWVIRVFIYGWTEVKGSKELQAESSHQKETPSMWLNFQPQPKRKGLKSEFMYLVRP